jgi:hypothetical protein
MAEEQPCRLVARVKDSEGPWEYMFASATSLGASLAVGQVARPTYYYIRSYRLDYRCECGGRSATVFTDNNFEVGTIVEPSSQVFATANVAVVLPIALSGAATQVAISVAENALGGVSVAVGWLEPEAVAARARELLGDPVIEQTRNEPVPVAVCGNHIRHHTGVIVQWPAVGETVPPPTDEEEDSWRLAREVQHMGSEFGRLFEQWARQIRDMLQDRDPEVRERGRRQLEDLRRQLERLIRIFRELAQGF